MWHTMNEPGKLFVVCNICGHVLISHNSGTTNLRRHMKSFHQTAYDQLLQRHNMDRDARLEDPTKKRPHGLEHTTTTKQTKTTKMTPKERVEVAQAIYCIATNRTLSDLDHPGTKAFVDACASLGQSHNFRPNSAVARQTAGSAVARIRSSIERILSTAEGVVLSIDFLETPGMEENRVFISARCVDNFKLRHCFLNDIKYSGKPNLEGILAAAEEDMKRFGIEDKVRYLVSNYDLSMHQIVTRRSHIEFIECLDSRLQRVVDASLTPLLGNPSGHSRLDMERALESARKVVETSAPMDRESLRRWWSSLGMVQQVLKKNKDQRLHENGHHGLDQRDQELLQAFQDTLRPFNSIFSMLVENFHCTSSLIPFLDFVVQNELSRLVTQESQKGNTEGATAAASLLKAHEQEFGTSIETSAADETSWKLHRSHLLAHALDPRFKQMKIFSNSTTKNKVWELLLADMMALGEGETSCERDGDQSVASMLRVVTDRDDMTMGDIAGSLFDNYSAVLSENDETSWAGRCQQELRLYRSETTTGMRTKNGKEDPLSWWEKHRVAFPILWTLAQVYLAIPAVASSPKLAFNVQESRCTVDRFIENPDLPPNSLFLLENGWALEE